MWTFIKEFMGGLWALTILALIITAIVATIGLGQWLIDITVQSFFGEIKCQTYKNY